MAVKVAALLVGVLLLGFVVGALGLNQVQAMLVLAVPLVIGVVWLIRAVLDRSTRR